MALADEPADAAEQDHLDPDKAPPSDSRRLEVGRRLLSKTLGGRQFWADAEFFHQWRIQQNVLAGQYRLLDDDDCRHASGTLQECQSRLSEIRTERQLAPMKGEAVILIHGLIRSSKSMYKLKQRLGLERDGFQTFSFGYPSTQLDIVESAEYLHRVIGSLQGIERIHFVAHSMGGLVVRAYLAEHDDPRIGRMVMIATPNQGAELADRFQKNILYRAVYGPAGQQLTRDPEGFIAGLPTPGFEFGVIAGGRGTANGYNPLIPGDDDGTVSVASTRLAGAADFVVVDRLHTFLITAPEAREYTVRFLKEGRFRNNGDKQPILPAAPADDVIPAGGERIE
ncbi:MAG: alpha/beta fold hydrolase [Planctomycetaceae bacterium]|nr:alpha/beta fold hydrolase [Planctomycetaceae bacterium]